MEKISSRKHNKFLREFYFAIHRIKLLQKLHAPRYLRIEFKLRVPTVSSAGFHQQSTGVVPDLAAAGSK